MIENIQLRNFKCFLDQEVSAGPLTIFSGLNGSGKSSVIQSLLLLRQTYLASPQGPSRLVSAGRLVDLGGFSDVLNESADADEIRFVIKGSKFSIESNFTEDSGNIIGASEANNALFSRLDSPGKLSRFQYLHAERYGPRKTQPISPYEEDEYFLGSHGEYTIDALNALQKQIVVSEKDPRYLKADTEQLGDQLEAWLTQISPGVRLAGLERVDQADLLVSGFSFGEEGELRSRPFRPTNVGFGLSYILPVLVALLASEDGALVIVENPEAHLHPSGQTMLGELCARAAAAGVQVILETHSDHVLDGARVAVKEGILAPQNACISYFERRYTNATIKTPTIDAKGRLSEWPSGFFDEHRRNAARIIMDTK